MATKLSCFNYPGYEATADAYGISAAVRTPPGSSIVAISGQTGSNLGEKFGTLEEQIIGAFKNADKALCAAVPELNSKEIWQCVFTMTFYLVGQLSSEVGMLLDSVAKSYLGNHRPAGTAVQVQALAYPECFIELQVQAAVKVD
ncbi:hypothetical protein LTR10_022500 [Elasticomyces elasticus]|uniref:Uncharacterized protein n=1 Tax=Exophiala sideris TaxID=1016849 RepID=A0ABR0J735_9EURO|nr:hypothetical protein LTR10_022500 [Elasticomyces elasticus]KAK5029449.1 hypothetical protein LTS07_005911 [Exophiala sideris]KAK5036853.1 hypothetical protein LTR13_005233 [Exophiala sideris]KAK5058079.1 hypothetical protein LTR69_007076 [Exophiala sideris]KAK5182038.1 hypothetical protein LTR44_005639 [Eurotiomycetes sp. CCFEE 6388]